MKSKVEFTGTVAPRTPANDRKGLGLSESPGHPFLKIKRALVPVDFSDSSRKGLLYAIEVARQFGAALDVVYVSPPLQNRDPYFFSANQEAENRLRSDSEETLASFVSGQIPEGLAFETFVRSGRPATEIILLAKQLNTDVIIIPMHGHTGLKSVLGGTTEQVVRHAPCPVFVIRETEHDFSPDL